MSNMENCCWMCKKVRSFWSDLWSSLSQGDGEVYSFGPYKIDAEEVFYSTRLSYAFVNLWPILPGLRNFATFFLWFLWYELMLEWWGSGLIRRWIVACFVCGNSFVFCMKWQIFEVVYVDDHFVDKNDILKTLHCSDNWFCIVTKLSFWRYSTLNLVVIMF